MFKTDDFELAAYEPESGYADPTSVTNSYITHAKARGTVFIQDCEVTGIRVRGGKVEGVDVGRGSFDALGMYIRPEGVHTLIGLEDYAIWASRPNRNWDVWNGI